MTEIRRVMMWRHLRAESASYVLRYRRGRLAEHGRGLSFWFLPLATSVAIVPADDQEEALLFHARTSDFQDVSVQGVITYRVVDPELTGSRIDFSVDLTTGKYTAEPHDRISLALSQLARESAAAWVGTKALRDVLRTGETEVRETIRTRLLEDALVREMGIGIVSVRIASLQPNPELERALEAPIREKIQEDADEATFRRRAQAVENERAIRENELQNEIELAVREEGLIAQRGQNERRRAEEQAEASRIAAEMEAARARIAADAEGGRIRVVASAEAERTRLIEHARVEAEEAHVAIYRDVPQRVMLGLAAQSLAEKLQRVDHVNVSPELLGPLLANLVEAGTRRLEQPGA